MIQSFFILSLFLLFCTGCVKQSILASSNITTQELNAYSKQHLVADFKRAGVAYPPKQLALLIFKQSKQLELYAENQGSWHFIKSFIVKAASGELGPKLHQGDYQVPEGIYRITVLNPHSHFLLSMKLNYPNAFDRYIAKLTHRHHLGNNIFIHGSAKSSGCIAIGDAGIRQLFPLVARVGIHHIQVIIAPKDLRYQKLVYSRVHPQWLPILYRRIRSVLVNFPLHEKL